MLKMSNAILTLNIGDVSYSKFSIPLMKKYAEKVGADFIEITERTIPYRSPHFEKWQISNYLNKYDRILYVDLDLLIDLDTPNIFELCDDKFCVVFEDIYKEYAPRRIVMDRIQYVNKDIGWKNGYFNSGVMLIPKSAKIVFEELKDFKKNYEEVWYDQTIINYLCKLHNIEMFGLGIEWNYIECFQDMKLPVDKINIYHYAGGGVDRNIGRDRYKQMEYRYKVINNDMG